MSRYGEMNGKVTSLVAAASFEERSLVATRGFLDGGGETNDVYLANVIEQNIEKRNNVDAFGKLGIEKIEALDRLDSRSLWGWTWRTIGAVPSGDLILDITCFPRELLGMILFAISLRRRRFGNVAVWYVGAPDRGYATVNPSLPASRRWLSRGVHRIRSIIGYPGEFSGERAGHLIALAGHEEERMMEIVRYVEPRRLSIGTGERGSGTSGGANEYSRSVVERLRSSVAVPDVGTIGFRSNSIDDVYEKLGEVEIDYDRENATLAAMNTKLTFVGAALFALRERRVRVMYAVPDRYNAAYCQGVGKEFRRDITDLIGRAKTEAL